MRVFRLGRQGPRDERPPDIAEGLRPAQAGIALSCSAQPVHVAASIIDLHSRGYLRIEKVRASDNPDWLFAGPADTAVGWGPARLSHRLSLRGLLPYERTVLCGLFKHADAVRLSELAKTKRWRRTVTKAYRQLNREALRRGWMFPGHLPPEVRIENLGNDDAQEMRRRLRDFRNQVHNMGAVGAEPWTVYREFLPYAVAFGLAPEWGETSKRFMPSADLADGFFITRDPVADLGGAVSNAPYIAAFTSIICSHVHSAVASSHGGLGGYFAGGHAGHAGGGFEGEGGGHHLRRKPSAAGKRCAFGT